VPVGLASSVTGSAVGVVAVVTLVGVLAGASTSAGAGSLGSASCRPQRLDADYARRVRAAILAKRDVWGDAQLASTQGPTYESARVHLKPLLLAGAPGHRQLTDSGVYYLAFGQPREPGSRGPIALHVADGSQILSDRADGPRLTLAVGRERFGSCLARLATPALYGGYYPILESRYVDAYGRHFEQESFAARPPQADAVASFVRLTVEARPGSSPTQIRFTPSETGLEARSGRLVRGSNTYLFFSAGGRFAGSSLVYRVESFPHTTSCGWCARARAGRSSPERRATSRPGGRSSPTGMNGSREERTSSCRTGACLPPSAAC
jgi:hypothetical protein